LQGSVNEQQNNLVAAMHSDVSHGGRGLLLRPSSVIFVNDESWTPWQNTGSSFGWRLEDKNSDAWSQVSGVGSMRSLFFWNVMQRWLAVSYRRFGTAYKDHLRG